MSFVDIIAVVPTVADNGGAISDAFSGETTGSIAAPGLAAGNIVAAISAPFIGLTVSGQMSGILAGFTIIKISAELSHDVPPGSIGLGDIIQVVAGAVTVTAAVAAATTGVVAAAPLLGVLGLTAAVAQLVANQNGYTADSVINAISPSTNRKYLEARNWTPPRDPLVLDLDGDGIEAIGIDPTRPILFDHDGDGTRNATGWIKGDDGIVVLDRNGNGLIDSGRELFGDQTLREGRRQARACSMPTAMKPWQGRTAMATA